MRWWTNFLDHTHDWIFWFLSVFRNFYLTSAILLVFLWVYLTLIQTLNFLTVPHSRIHVLLNLFQHRLFLLFDYSVWLQCVLDDHLILKADPVIEHNLFQLALFYLIIGYQFLEHLLLHLQVVRLLVLISWRRSKGQLSLLRVLYEKGGTTGTAG